MCESERESSVCLSVCVCVRAAGCEERVSTHDCAGDTKVCRKMVCCACCSRVFVCAFSIRRASFADVYRRARDPPPCLFSSILCVCVVRSTRALSFAAAASCASCFRVF